MKIKHLFVSILLVTGFQPMIAQSALRQQFVIHPYRKLVLGLSGIGCLAL